MNMQTFEELKRVLMEVPERQLDMTNWNSCACAHAIRDGWFRSASLHDRESWSWLRLTCEVVKTSKLPLSHMEEACEFGKRGSVTLHDHGFGSPGRSVMCCTRRRRHRSPARCPGRFAAR